MASDEPVSAALDVARQAANEPLPAAPESLLKGAGVTIAMLDSGVAPHADIQTLVASIDFVGNPGATAVLDLPDDSTRAESSSVDPNGHGTHVAGILVGSGSHSDEGRLAGIAPAASLVSVRVLDEAGGGRTSDVLAGLQWVLDHKDELGIRVLNLSLGHPVYEPAAQDPLVQEVEALWSAGIVVVCSAGNAGRDGDGTISSPCNSREVISVGASNDRKTPDTSDDTVATYSSRGPTRIDLVAKPDLLAPGNRIVSTRSPGSHLDLLAPERRVAGDPAVPEVHGVLRAVGHEHGRAHGGRDGRADARAGARPEPGDGQGEADALGAEARGGEPARHRRRGPRHHGRSPRDGAGRRRPVAARVPGRRHRRAGVPEHRRAVVGALLLAPGALVQRRPLVRVHLRGRPRSSLLRRAAAGHDGVSVRDALGGGHPLGGGDSLGGEHSLGRGRPLVGRGRGPAPARVSDSWWTTRDGGTTTRAP